MQAIRKNMAVDRSKSLKVVIDTSLGVGDTFTIPTIVGPAYNYSVRWGDGTSSIGLTGSASHSYSSPGIYNIEIKGEFPQFYFNNGGDKSKLISIEQWGKTNLRTSQFGAFYGCNNLLNIPNDVKYLNTIITGTNMFRNCSKLPAIPEGVVFGSLITADSMFQGCSILNYLPSSLTLINLFSAQNMFVGTSIIDVPIGVKLISLRQGYNMFYGITLPKARYSQLLIDIQTIGTVNSGQIHGGNSKYNAAGKTSRDILTSSPRSWTITDGGYLP